MGRRCRIPPYLPLSKRREDTIFFACLETEIARGGNFSFWGAAGPACGQFTPVVSALLRPARRRVVRYYGPALQLAPTEAPTSAGPYRFHRCPDIPAATATTTSSLCSAG